MKNYSQRFMHLTAIITVTVRLDISVQDQSNYYDYDQNTDGGSSVAEIERYPDQPPLAKISSQSGQRLRRYDENTILGRHLDDVS